MKSTSTKNNRKSFTSKPSKRNFTSADLRNIDLENSEFDDLLDYDYDLEYARIKLDNKKAKDFRKSGNSKSEEF
jgi:hypothetical protein